MPKARNPEEACGVPTRVCLCGHDGFEHRFGRCVLCQCTAFEARPCSKKQGSCSNHDRELFRDLTAESYRRALAGNVVLSERFDQKSCGVYFIRCANFVKIGRSISIEQRMAMLAGSVPFRLELIGFIQCEYALLGPTERGLQHRFAGLRERGEWFRLETPLVDFIASLKEGAA